jgi:nucleoside-diphosphate-sugar epimerase
VRIIVFGATGVVGRAAAEHFVESEDCEVITVSRRPVDINGVRHVPLDLSDSDAARREITSNVCAGVTHVVFAALQEFSDLASGWRDRDLMDHNLRLFRNSLEPLVQAHGSTLRHVSLLQGAKAYGLHVGRTPVPAKERAARDAHENFYFLQEDALRALAEDGAWSWTILRPQVVFGQSFGSPMNLLPAIGAYAAMELAQGNPLSFPGGVPGVHEAVDARLLASALAWAANSPAARGEIFNITNGDVYGWHDVWPTIASALGMEVGEPRPRELSEVMPRRADEWSRVVDRYSLRAPRDLAGFVGNSWTYADILFGTLGGRPLPALLSTVKIRQAGFADCIDTEDMFREWFARLQEARLLPPP